MTQSRRQFASDQQHGDLWFCLLLKLLVSIYSSVRVRGWIKSCGKGGNVMVEFEYIFYIYLQYLLYLITSFFFEENL
jgi:hypothetical protein